MKSLGIVVLAAIIASVAVMEPAPADAGGFARAVMRGAAKSARRSSARGFYRAILKRDAAAHARTPARSLLRDRTVVRYTTKQQARAVKAKGLPAGRHVTATGGPGRPLNPSAAKNRYGLQKKPHARITIDLPKGHPVRPHKVIAGDRGRGTLTSPLRVPPERIRKVVPLTGRVVERATHRRSAVSYAR